MRANHQTGGLRRAARFVLMLLLVLAAEARLTRMDLRVSRVEALPPSAAPAHTTDNILTYSSSGQIAINGRPVTLMDLHTALEDLYRHRRDRTLWLEGDGSVPYGKIAQVVDIARRAGVERIGVITPGMRAEQRRQ